MTPEMVQEGAYFGKASYLCEEKCFSDAKYKLSDCPLFLLWANVLQGVAQPRLDDFRVDERPKI